jgi:hypothetical protein|tara:strand:+ start:2173 stop:2475 length:303 start_codon:yes stop_codon:yes gene_type:complete
MAVSYSNTSNYSTTGLNRRNLDLYNPKISADSLDEETLTIIIQNKFDRRPDLLAFNLYGSARLWWVFTHYNRDIIKDPIFDFKAGTKIVVPKTYRVTGSS